MKHTLLLIILSLAGLAVWAQPDVNAKGMYTTVNGDEIEDASDGQEAPLQAHFSAEITEGEGYDLRFEWKITQQGEEQTPLVHRFEEEIDYTFTQSGTFVVQLYVTCTPKNDDAEPEEVIPAPIIVTITESKLEMPNAFSPNGDGINDYYNAKSGYQSIVSFKATVFNRWGQKIHFWTSLKKEEGWDGKWNGHTVKDGVYFVVVDAMGADGKHYKIKRDVNVLTGIPEKSNGNNGTEE